MKQLRRISGGFFLVLALSVPTFAGDILNPPVQQNSPVTEAEVQTSPVTELASDSSILNVILTFFFS